MTTETRDDGCEVCGLRMHAHKSDEAACLRTAWGRVKAELAAERAWRKRATIAGTAILDALHHSFGTHDAEQGLRNALQAPVTTKDSIARPKGTT